jgi:hypothetical protein
MMLAASQAFRVLLLTATPFVNVYTDVLNLFAMVEGISPLLANPDKGFERSSLPDRSTFEAMAEDGDSLIKYTTIQG